MRSPDPIRTLACQLCAVETGRPVTLMGHVHRRRELSSVAFLILRDRTGLAQVVVTPGQMPGSGLPSEETPVQITGVAKANPQAPNGVEVTEPTITALSDPAHTPPFELWRPALQSGLAATLDHASVSWRHPMQRAKWQIAAASMAGFRHTLDSMGFTEIQSPKLVESATESGANVFPVDFFGRSAYLAQSPQFYKQQLVGVYERVYEVGPVFRAEPHDTARHLAEYVSMDAELGFIGDHRDVLEVLTEVLRGMLNAVEQSAPAALDLLGIDTPTIPADVPVIHFSDALRSVGASDDESDLAPEHERALGDWALKEFGSDVIAVEGYPMRKRPFYTCPQAGDDRWSNSFDLLFRGMELVTGGQRLHRYPDYISAIESRGEDPEQYHSYLQTFRHGMPPHGGFAIGLERWTARLIGAPNIREVALFPRDLHRLTP
jgi:nondiscriminating aspartyl-tRNA synthetase